MGADPELVEAIKDNRNELQIAKSAFGDLRTAEVQTLFNIDPTFGLTRRRQQWFSNGSIFDSTLFAEETAEIRLNTRADQANDDARTQSAFPGQYRAHFLSQPGMSFRVGPGSLTTTAAGLPALTHGEIQWGAFWFLSNQIDNGFGIELNADGAEIFFVKEGSHIGDSPVSQSDWNIDVMDGDGPSGITWDPKVAYVYNFPHVLYNAGSIGVGVIRATERLSGALGDNLHLMHVFDDDLQEPMFGKSNLPTQIRINNAGTAQRLDAFQGYMQYARYGGAAQIDQRDSYEFRSTSGGHITTTIADGDPPAEPGEPLIAIRRASGREQLIVKPSTTFVDADSDLLLHFWEDPDLAASLTNESFGPPSTINFSAETGIETDTSATAYDATDGSYIGQIMIEGGQGGQEVGAQVERVVDRVPVNIGVVITAVIRDGSQSADADITQRILEGL